VCSKVFFDTHYPRRPDCSDRRRGQWPVLGRSHRSASCCTRERGSAGHGQLGSEPTCGGAEQSSVSASSERQLTLKPHDRIAVAEKVRFPPIGQMMPCVYRQAFNRMTHSVRCGPAFDLNCARPAVTRVLLAMLPVRAGAWRQPYPRFRLAATKSARASDGPARRYHAYQRGSHGKDRFHARAAAVMPKLALSYAIKRGGHRVDASLGRGPFLAGQYLAPAEDRRHTGSAVGVGALNPGGSPPISAGDNSPVRPRSEASRRQPAPAESVPRLRLWLVNRANQRSRDRRPRRLCRRGKKAPCAERLVEGPPPQAACHPDNKTIRILGSGPCKILGIPLRRQGRERLPPP